MPPRGQQRIRDLHGTGTADRLVVMVLLSLSVYEGIIRLSVVGSRKCNVGAVAVGCMLSTIPTYLDSWVAVVDTHASPAILSFVLEQPQARQCFPPSQRLEQPPASRHFTACVSRI